MSVTQYVGARYVTKIYENSLDPSSAEWEANVNYEPLTMVTYNYGSYLSKKEVPATIGDPSNNAAYWAQTGFYNGQIASLQSQIDTINTELLNNIKSVKNYGAVGDGLTDDTQAFVDAIADCNLLYVPSGTYLINSLEITNNLTMIGDGLNTVLKCNDTVDKFIYLNAPPAGMDINPIYNRSLGKMNIMNLTIDCSGLANYGIYCKNNYYNTIYGINVYAHLDTGIFVKNGAYNHIENCVIHGDGIHTNVVGIWFDAADQCVMYCETVDCKVGFRVGTSGHFFRCCAWISNASMYHNSVSFNVRGSYSSLLDCTADTMENPVIFDNDCKEVRVNGLNVINNDDVVTPNIAYVYLFSNREDGLNWYDIPVSIENTDIHISTALKLTNYPSLASMLSKIETPMCTNPALLDAEGCSDNVVLTDTYFKYEIHRIAPKLAECKISLANETETIPANTTIEGTYEFKEFATHHRIPAIIKVGSNYSLMNTIGQAYKYMITNTDASPLVLEQLEVHVLMHF